MYISESASDVLIPGNMGASGTGAGLITVSADGLWIGFSAFIFQYNDLTSQLIGNIVHPAATVFSITPSIAFDYLTL